MNYWKLDSVDFSNYGVGVISASGLLGESKIIIPNHDWLDEYGIEFSPDTTKYKTSDREIILHCFIVAGNYADFETKVNAFWNAIKGTQRVLSCDYIDSLTVYLKDEIQITRQTSWIENKQAGKFRLRMIVPGEDAGISVNIYREYIYNVITTVQTTNLKVNKSLQGDWYASMTFETNEKIPIKYFDFIRVNYQTDIWENFHLESDPEFKKLSTNKFQYNLKFEHPVAWLKRAKFLDADNGADFNYHANVEEIVELIVSNHDREWWTNFEKGTIVATERRLHTFNGENCYDVLRRICEEYELEYEFIKIAPSRHAINVKQEVGIIIPVTLKYGKGNGLYQLIKSRIFTDKLCTVLYAYGAKRNLEPEYRGGLRRLSFNANPLKNNEGLYTGYGPKEVTVFWDDIYPRRTSTVTSFTMKLPGKNPAQMTRAEEEKWPQGIFLLRDASIPPNFNLNDYFLGGISGKVHIKTGDMAGLNFEILSYDHDNREIFIIPFKNDKGYFLPNEDLYITPGDEYTLIDIGMPENHLLEAEDELQNRAAEYLSKFSHPIVEFKAIVDPVFVAANSLYIEAGDKILVTDTDFGEDGNMRVISLIYDAVEKSYELILSDIIPLSLKQETEIRLRAVERNLGESQKDTSESASRDVETTNELRNRILDPIDDKLRLDQNVRNESIDPRMFAYDAGIPMWNLIGSLVETNYLGQKNWVRIGNGKIFIINNPASVKSRYGIFKMAENNLEYNPVREWIVLGKTIVLPTDNAYQLYAKLDLREGSTWCDVYAVENHIEVKKQIASEYLNYKLGTISAATSPRYANMLWGNVKYIGEAPDDGREYIRKNKTWATISKNKNLSGETNGETIITGSLKVQGQLTGTINGHSIVAGYIKDVNALIGSSDGISIVSGTLTSPTPLPLNGETNGSSNVTGKLKQPEQTGEEHNSLEGLQGGNGTDEFYHITAAEKTLVEDLSADDKKEWQTFEYRNIEVGTADTFVFDPMADVPFIINSVVLEVDNGTLTGIAVKINGVAVTGLSSVTATTTATRTNATAANAVVVGDKITFEITTGYTGTPTKLIGKLSYTRT